MPRKSQAAERREQKLQYLQNRLQAHRELLRLFNIHVADIQNRIIEINEDITALQVKGIK